VLFPKSNNIILKRALERRKVFTAHLEKLSKYLERKQWKTKHKKKIKTLKEQKLHIS
jgi:hypothetical protein